MQPSEQAYWVGGGALKFILSEERGCRVYMIDGGRDLAMVDAELGITIEPILTSMRFDGPDPGQLQCLVLTHVHASQAGTAFGWHERFGVEGATSWQTAEHLSKGDEERVSLSIAKEGGFYTGKYVFNPARSRTRAIKKTSSGSATRVAGFPNSRQCSGMLSLILCEEGKSILFPGDAVFHGDKLLPSNTWDGNLEQYVQSIEKLARQRGDTLLSGHLTITMDRGGRRAQKALQTLEGRSSSPNII